MSGSQVAVKARFAADVGGTMSYEIPPTAVNASRTTNRLRSDAESGATTTELLFGEHASADFEAAFGKKLEDMSAEEQGAIADYLAASEEVRNLPSDDLDLDVEELYEWTEVRFHVRRRDRSALTKDKPRTTLVTTDAGQSLLRSINGQHKSRSVGPQVFEVAQDPDGRGIPSDVTVERTVGYTTIETVDIVTYDEHSDFIQVRDLVGIEDDADAPATLDTDKWVPDPAAETEWVDRRFEVPERPTRFRRTAYDEFVDGIRERLPDVTELLTYLQSQHEYNITTGQQTPLPDDPRAETTVRMGPYVTTSDPTTGAMDLLELTVDLRTKRVASVDPAWVVGLFGLLEEGDLTGLKTTAAREWYLDMGEWSDGEFHLPTDARQNIWATIQEVGAQL